MTKWSLEVILVDLVMAIVINTSAMTMAGDLSTFVKWYPGTASAFFTNVLLQLVIPVPAIARTLSSPLEGKPGHCVLAAFVENLIFVTCISFTMAIIQANGRSIVDLWLETYVQLVAIGFVTLLVCQFVARRAAAAKAERPGGEGA